MIIDCSMVKLCKQILFVVVVAVASSCKIALSDLAPSIIDAATDINDVDSSHSSSLASPPDDLTPNNTRCSQTRLSFTKETLLHIWDIKGLLGYISYIKRFDQPFELKTEHVSFKSDNVDGKWIFKVHKVRHNSPFSSITSPSPLISHGYHPHPPNDIGDIRIVAIYSYEAKHPRKIDFLIHLTLIQGSKEIVLPAQRSTSPSIVQQRYYNTRGYQLNSNFLEYVYTFTWTDLAHALDNIKTSNNYHSHNHQPFRGDDTISEEFFEEITRTDMSGHFGDVMMKFVITAYFPGEPISVSSSRCNSSVLELVSHDILEKSGPATPNNFHKDHNVQKLHGTNPTPPYFRYLNSMLHDDRFADVLLVVGKEEIPAHRIVLATSSPVFSAILENTTVSTSNTDTNVPGCNSSSSFQNLPKILVQPEDLGLDCVHELLRYIYTGTVENMKMVDYDLVKRLIIAADTYGLPELKRHCESILLQGLKADNAIELYLLGNRVTSSKIARKALNIMKLNKAKLASQTEDFRQLSLQHPKLMYELFLST